jgi:hypothetical protein
VSAKSYKYPTHLECLVLETVSRTKLTNCGNSCSLGSPSWSPADVRKVAHVWTWDHADQFVPSVVKNSGNPQ